MCGSVHALPVSASQLGELTFSDIRIKRVGIHAFRTAITETSTDFSAEKNPEIRQQLQELVVGAD